MRTLSVIPLLLSCAGCNCGGTVVISEDAASGLDASAADARSDVGSPLTDASTLDASLDAGSPEDAASTQDASLDAGSPEDAASTLDASLAASSPEDAGAGDARCPLNMAAIEGRYCIDRWEASLVVITDAGEQPWSPYQQLADQAVRAVTAPATVPQGYLSAIQARDACARSGKRLCTSDEWLKACEGPQGTTYPYGDTYAAKKCNEDRPVNPVVEYFGPDAGDVIWDSTHMNDPALNQLPNSESAAGAFADCTNSWGVFDMVGNLNEWVDGNPDPTKGTFRGGYYVDAELNGSGCHYVTTAHSSAYHDFSTGFRCCQ